MRCATLYEVESALTMIKKSAISRRDASSRPEGGLQLLVAFKPDDIEIKEFVPTLRGYDRAEVRAYLRAVALDIRRLEEEVEAAKAAPPAVAAAVPSAAVASPGLDDAIRQLTVAIAYLADRDASYNVNRDASRDEPRAPSRRTTKHGDTQPRKVDAKPTAPRRLFVSAMPTELTELADEQPATRQTTPQTTRPTTESTRSRSRSMFSSNVMLGPRPASPSESVSEPISEPTSDRRTPTSRRQEQIGSPPMPDRRSGNPRRARPVAKTSLPPGLRKRAMAPMPVPPTPPPCFARPATEPVELSSMTESSNVSLEPDSLTDEFKQLLIDLASLSDS